MTPFCDNPLCRYHIDVPDSVGNQYQLLEDNYLVNLVRHPLHTKTGRTYNFCSTCSNVIQIMMANAAPTEAGKND